MCWASDWTRACAAESSPRRSRAASSASRADFSDSSSSAMRTRTACNSSCSSRSRCCASSRSAVQSMTCSARRTFSDFALLLLGGGGLQLRLQLGQMRRDLRQHRLNALHGEHRAAPALFQRGHVGANFGWPAAPLHRDAGAAFQAALRGLHLGFQSTLLLFVLEQLAELLGDEASRSARSSPTRCSSRS